MEVRLLSVGTRGFFLDASRLAIAAQFCRPQREKNLLHQGTRPGAHHLTRPTYNEIISILSFMSIWMSVMRQI